MQYMELLTPASVYRIKSKMFIFQNVYGKVASLGLKSQYDSESEFAKVVTYLFVVNLFPRSQMVAHWDNIKAMFSPYLNDPKVE